VNQNDNHSGQETGNSQTLAVPGPPQQDVPEQNTHRDDCQYLRPGAQDNYYKQTLGQHAYLMKMKKGKSNSDRWRLMTNY